MQRSSLAFITIALIATLLLLSVAVVDAKPGKTGGRPPRGGGAGGAGGAGSTGGLKSGKTGRNGGATNPSPAPAGKAGKVAADPSLFTVKPVNAPRDAFAPISVKPAVAGDASKYNNRQAPRSHKLGELAPKNAQLKQSTRTVGKTGPAKTHEAGRKSIRASAGSIPRPSGVKGKFNPRGKNSNVMAFGRGAPVSGPAGKAGKAGKTGGKSGKRGKSGAAGGISSASSGASASSAAPAAPAAGRKGRKGRSFVEIQTQVDASADGDAPATDVQLVKPVIEEGTVGLAEPAAPAKKEVTRPCPKDAALLEVDQSADAAADAEVDADIEAEVDAEVDAEAETESHADSLGELMVETQLESETEAESEAEAETVADLAAQVDAVVEADTTSTAGDLKLPSGLVITAAQLDAIRAAFPKQPTERVFYHWAGYQQSIRWGRNRKIDQGEIAWMNTQMTGMAAGGGYYLAQDPNGSRAYGPVPCYIRTPAGAMVLDQSQTPISSVLKKTLSLPDKVALGAVIPFIHYYSTTNGWWVTHHQDMLNNIRCGNAVITPDPVGAKPIPNPVVNVDGYIDVMKNGLPAGSRFVSVHFDGFNNQVTKMPNIATQFDAHAYLENMITENWDADNVALGKDVKDAALWVRSFFVLMQYIDGLSLVRAKKVAPADPWSVFEPQNFGNFLNTFNSHIQRRMTKTKYGIATNGYFGDGTTPSVWAKKMVDVTLPEIYAQLSGGGEMKYRKGTVRAGGPEKQDPANKWTTGYFYATKKQVDVMQKNPFLSVEASNDPASTNLFFTAYYYPSPIHLSGINIAKQLSPELQANIKAAANYTGADGAAALARDTPLLMRDLLIDLFTRMHGTRAAETGTSFQGALKAALDLVSIHPCSDFNGRSTRFFMFAAAMEANGIVPVSFMSDLDIVTEFSAYNLFMTNANNGYLQLKVAMISEMISALCNNVIARQYELPEWGTFLSTALSQFGKKQFSYELTDEENEMVRTRKFVPLLDKWFGTTWPGRNN